MESSTILYCRDRLEEQLLKAKESLKGVDSNLKKFVSRTVSDQPPRNTFNKTSIPLSDRWKTNRNDPNFNTNSRRRPAKVLGDDIENIPVKKRLGPKVLHSSLSGPPRRSDDYDDGPMKKPTVSSCVVAKPQILPPRKEATAVKTYKETRARDRRMFGALIGTLQKFRQEETQLKDKEDKKAQVEKKLEEAARREKENLRRERQKLMDFKKQRESYIKAVENNMKLVKEQEQWEELHRPLFNYIQTETKPPIYYLPKVHTDQTLELLESGKVNLTKLIEEKRQSVKEEVDSLIAQWKNVNVEELLENDGESLPKHTTDRNDDDDQVTTNVPWENDDDLKTSRLVANGSSNTKESSKLYSAKERRIKRKDIAIKQEQEEDDEYRISIKQEKITEAADEEENNAAEESGMVETNEETNNADDTDTANKSPNEEDDGNASES